MSTRVRWDGGVFVSCVVKTEVGASRGGGLGRCQRCIAGVAVWDTTESEALLSLCCDRARWCAYGLLWLKNTATALPASLQVEKEEREGETGELCFLVFDVSQGILLLPEGCLMFYE